MYWNVLDDYTVRRYSPKGSNSILIRVLEPRYKDSGEPYNIYNINKYSNVLKLYFDDLREEPPIKYKDRFVVFNKEECMKLINFIHENSFDEVVVHCNAGVSRSSAIMICVSRLLNLSNIEEAIYNNHKYSPNPLILKVFEDLNL